MRGDIREAALGRLGAIHDDDTIEADPLPTLGKGGRPACTWGFIRPPGAPGGKNVADGEPNAPAQLVDLLMDRRPGASVPIERHMVCLPMVTRELALGTVGATVRPPGPPGAVLKVNCMAVSIIAEPASLAQRYVPSGRWRRPSVTASLNTQAGFGADQDGARVHQTALTRHGCWVDADAHHGSETADRHYEQENHHLRGCGRPDATGG